MTKLTQERLKEALNYNHDTGVFTWIKKITKRTHIGDVAGCIDFHGYSLIGLDFYLHKAHRLAWLYVHGVWPNKIDHINHDRSDNRLINLRNSTDSENQRNQSLSKANTSGFTGVVFNKRDELWTARVTIKGKTINLGCFTDKADAIKRRQMANVLYGFHENHGQALKELK